MNFSEWLNYQGLRLRAALGLVPPPPRGIHVHKCQTCGTLWMHAPGDGENEIAAHTCPRPGCGHVEFWPLGSKQIPAPWKGLKLGDDEEDRLP
jgi:rubredoxin